MPLLHLRMHIAANRSNGPKARPWCDFLVRCGPREAPYGNGHGREFAMLLIPCPWCGPRSQVEFTYGGDATLVRPADDAPEQMWFEYVYLRDNPRGPHDEAWWHGAGCRSWFKLRRDTRTHDILSSAPFGDQPPGAPP